MASKLSLVSRIQAFNAGRDPQRLRLKYAAMKKDAFGFLRGSCHLFYEDLDTGALPKSPLVWCSGDLHLGNFGSYKSDNRLTYFDINDFDEACLAPATWDLVRFLSSLRVAAHCVAMSEKAVTALTRAFLDSYTEALREGKARWVERALAQGIIRTLMVRVRKRERREFLNARTSRVNGRRKLTLDGKRALPLRSGERTMLREFMATYAARQPNSEFFRFEDAARRIAGLGSLGLDRYIILMAGRGGPNGNFLLDLKYEPGSCVLRTSSIPQPAWTSDADRVATVQRDVQAVAPALLNAVRMDRRSWLLRELMPTGDRLSIELWRNNETGITEAVRTLGEIVAWGNIRAHSRRGAAGVEALVDFANTRGWMGSLAEISRDRARCTVEQWREFSKQAV